MSDKNDVSIIIEQYKIYVETAQRVTENRNQNNKFYISLLSAIIAIIGLIINKFINDCFIPIYILIIGILGLILCFVWCLSIKTYKRLNSAKYAVIHDMEQRLPEACFNKEWEILQNASKSRQFAITRTEMMIPLLLSLLFIIMIIISFIKI